MYTTNNSSRFSATFPILNRIIEKPLASGLICFTLGALASFYSIHIGLSFFLLYYVFLAYYIDRRHINYMLVPPLVMLASFEFMRMGLGPAIYSFSHEGSLDANQLKMQISQLLSFPILMLFYYLINDRVPAFTIPDLTLSKNKKLSHYLKNFSIFSLTFLIIGLFAGTISGSLDRGDAGLFYDKSRVSLSMVYQLLIRFGDLSLLLFPLLYISVGRIARILLVIFLISLTIYFFLTGSRGLIGWSGIYLIMGSWLFLRDNKKLPYLILLLITVMFFLIPTMAHYRSTAAFNESELRKPIARVAAISETFKSMGSVNINSNIELTGTSLIGVFSDRLIYEKTPNLIPYAGWEEMTNVLYVFMPSFLFPNKPQLYGSDRMLQPYTGVLWERSNGTISLNADLYRRFGWVGVFFGTIIFGVVYSYLVRVVFTASSSGSFFGLMGAIFFMGMFRAPPTGTVLRTFWHFLWEIPKYYLSLYLFDLFHSFFQKLYSYRR